MTDRMKMMSLSSSSLLFIFLFLFFPRGQSFQSINSIITYHHHCHHFPSCIRLSTTMSQERRSISSLSTLQPLSRLSTKRPIHHELVRLFMPVGYGMDHGDRFDLHLVKARRHPSDPHLWTHAFFLLPLLVSAKRGLFDLFILLAILTPLSLVYHIRFEKPGKLASLEGLVAKVLFLYGLGQLCLATSLPLLVAEATLALLTILCFVITNLKKELYDPWHSGMHIFPSCWALLAALYHPPLLPIAWTISHFNNQQQLLPFLISL